MNILVVGSKGFIGSHTFHHFSSKGHDVTGCDVEGPCTENYFPFSILHDGYHELFKTRSFDVCINAAGSANVAYSFDFPEKDFELNVSLVTKLLAAIKTHAPLCKLINFSSAAVYGNPGVLPITEDTVLKPLSPYGYHKLLSEQLLQEYYRFFRINTCSLRVFSAYGEGLCKQLFWDMHRQVKESGHIRLFGTGNESRDFIYIADLVDILELVISKAPFHGETYNVGNGEEVTVAEAASAFALKTDPHPSVTFSGVQKIGDPLNWRADITKIKALGFTRKYSFVDGVENYCKWLREKN